MIFKLAQDFHDAVTVMPAEHPKHRMLELFEEAIRHDLHFINLHPTILFQCMWNACWWYDCIDGQNFEDDEQGLDLKRASSNIKCPGFRKFFKTWGNGRQGGPYWLRANAPLPTTHRKVAHFKKTSPIQAFCANRGLLAVAQPTGTTETYAVPPGLSLFSKELSCERIAALAMFSYSAALAFRDVNGVIGVEGCSATFQGRPGETPFLARSNGSIVTINGKNTLVAWFPTEGHCESLLENVPFPLRVLKDFGQGNGIFFVAGARKQQLGIIEPTEN